jgi:hypothetical protein
VYTVVGLGLGLFIIRIVEEIIHLCMGGLGGRVPMPNRWISRLFIIGIIDKAIVHL